MDFLSFFEVHVKPVSVFCDCLIGLNAIRFARMEFVTELLSARPSVEVVRHKMGSSASHGEGRKSESRKTQLRSSCHQQYPGETRYESK